MDRLIDIEKSSGYFVIKTLNGEEIKIDVKDMKDNSPILLAVADEKNKLMQQITLSGTGFDFMIIENKANLFFKPVSLQEKNISLQSQYNKISKNHIFSSEVISDTQLNYLYTYYPEQKYVNEKTSNELFAFAKKSMTHHDYFHQNLFEKYVNIFNKYVIKKLIAKNEIFIICCVPSHNECNKINNTMSAVIKSVKKKYLKNFFIDGSDILHRKYVVEKSSLNNSVRSIEKQYNSLIVNNSDLIRDKTILLIDDFYTTGSSMNACKMKLLEAGAKKVIMFTFGKTR